MKFYFLTLFPEVINSYLDHGIIKRAIDSGKVEAEVINIRDFSKDKHKRVDDYPFSGGPGMLMTPQPLADSIRSIPGWEKMEVIYPSPAGEPFNQVTAKNFAENNKDIIFICGHYEGIDQRIIDTFVTKEVSLGDFVLTGGELPALSFFDSIIRLKPGILGNNESSEDESFNEGLLEYPQFTRPQNFEGMEVPEILLSGDHKRIKDWKVKESIKRTKLKRPDLYRKYKEGEIENE